MLNANADIVGCVTLNYCSEPLRESASNFVIEREDLSRGRRGALTILHKHLR